LFVPGKSHPGRLFLSQLLDFGLSCSAMVAAARVAVAVAVGTRQVASLRADAVDFATVFGDDDECSADQSACALELSQLRASKVKASPGPANVAASAFAGPAELLQQPKIQVTEGPGVTAVDYGHPEWLQSCHTIFLDLGSGKGANFHKLFEPNQFPESKMMPIIDAAIGSRGWRRAPFEKTGLCALGLEPDPALQEELLSTQQEFEQQGWHVHFYPMAAWVRDGYMLFDTSSQPDEVDAGDHQHLSMSSPMAQEAGDGMVPTVDIASFIASLPPKTVKLMVVDIEGAEYEALAGLMQQRLMCQYFVGHALIRAREWGNIEHWGALESFSPGVHPRSFLGITERMRQLKDLSWCAPGEPTEVLELDASDSDADSKPDDQSLMSLSQPVVSQPLANGLIATSPVVGALLAKTAAADMPVVSETMPVASAEPLAIAPAVNVPATNMLSANALANNPAVAGSP